MSNWISLLNTLVYSASVMSQKLIKSSESSKSENSVMTWNILRGGISSGTLDDNSENPIAEYIKEIKKEEGSAFEVCQIIKKLVKSDMIPPFLKVKLSGEMKKRWDYIINLCCICLMYHSDIIEDAFDYAMGMYDNEPDQPKYEEKLRIVGRYTANIIRWVQSSLQGEKYFVINKELGTDSLLETVIKEINQIIEKTWSDKEEKLSKEAEEKIKLEEEHKKKFEEDKKALELKIQENDKIQKSNKDKSGPSSAGIKISVSKGGNKIKKRNRTKLMNPILMPKSKKKAKKAVEEVKEEIKEEVEHEEDHKEAELLLEKKPIELTDQEAVNLSKLLYSEVYTLIFNKLKDAQILKSLCNRFSIKLDEIDPKPMINKV